MDGNFDFHWEEQFVADNMVWQQSGNVSFEEHMKILMETNQFDEEILEFAISQGASFNAMQIRNEVFDSKIGYANTTPINPVLHNISGNQHIGQKFALDSNIENINKATNPQETTAGGYSNNGPCNEVVNQNHDQERSFLNIEICPDVPNNEKPMNIMGQHFLRLDNTNIILPIHKGRKSFQCECCKKTFSYQSQLNLHSLTHTGEKPFSCDICHKKFSRRGNLKDHKLTHTGEKRFQCDYCGKAFIKKGNFKDHIFVNHDKKHFKCEHCDAFFLSRRGLLYHRRMHIK